MSDDTGLKFIFYLVISLSVIAIIGVWEFFLEPLLAFLIDSVHLV